VWVIFYRGDNLTVGTRKLCVINGSGHFDIDTQLFGEGVLWFRIGNGEKQEMPFGRYQKLKREAPKEESNECR
jgi:hypothetical protein